MGPRAGLGEIRLPAVQPGSSIMPGKVNPSIPEMVNQVCFQVMGCDATICAAAEAGQLELNVMMPVIAWNALHASTHPRAGADRAARRAASTGIEADAERCRELLDRSTASPPRSARISATPPRRTSRRSRSRPGDRSARSCSSAGCWTRARLDEILSPEAMTAPGIREEARMNRARPLLPRRRARVCRGRGVAAQQDRGRPAVSARRSWASSRAPDRDAWQKPDLIMDALRIGDGSVVADVGAGGGWFTVRLARRVGPNGKVYAEDIQPEMLAAIRAPRPA